MPSLKERVSLPQETALWAAARRKVEVAAMGVDRSDVSLGVIGLGNLKLGQEMRKSFPEARIIGVERDAHAVKAARNANQPFEDHRGVRHLEPFNEIIWADVRKLDKLVSEKFVAVVAKNLMNLQSEKEQRQTLQAVNEVLRDQGVFIASIPMFGRNPERSIQASEAEYWEEALGCMHGKMFVVNKKLR